MKRIIKNITNNDIINGSFIMPDWVTEIGKSAFDGCKSLKKISIPKGVTEIGEGDDYGWEEITD